MYNNVFWIKKVNVTKLIQSMMNNVMVYVQKSLNCKYDLKSTTCITTCIC